MTKNKQSTCAFTAFLVTSLAATLLLLVGAIANVSPISWVFDLNDWIK